MNCFEYSARYSKLTKGLLIDPPGYVGIIGQDQMTLAGGTVEKALLSADLLQRFLAHSDDKDFVRDQIRLARCDFEKRAQIWLTPETPGTQNQALVLCTAIAITPKAALPSCEIQGAGCEILGKSPATYLNPAYKGWSVLAVLAPGGKLKIVRPSFWRTSLGLKQSRVQVLSALPGGTISASSEK